MNKALDLRIPQSTPQVSRLSRVLLEAIARNCCRNWEGMKTGRRGSPFSRYAVGLKVNSSSSFDGVGGPLPSTLSGTGGTLSANFPGIGGGRGFSIASFRGDTEGLGGRGGGDSGVGADL